MSTLLSKMIIAGLPGLLTFIWLKHASVLSYDQSNNSENTLVILLFALVNSIIPFYLFRLHYWGFFGLIINVVITIVYLFVLNVYVIPLIIKMYLNLVNKYRVHLKRPRLSLQTTWSEISSSPAAYAYIYDINDRMIASGLASSLPLNIKNEPFDIILVNHKETGVETPEDVQEIADNEKVKKYLELKEYVNFEQKVKLLILSPIEEKKH